MGALRCLGGGALVTMLVSEANASMVIDGHEQELPDGTLSGIASIAGDAVAGPLNAAELLDVDVQQFPGSFALVADDRFGRREVAQLRQAGAEMAGRTSG